MVKMRCLIKMPYARRDLLPGDIFEVDEGHVLPLTFIGKAEEVHGRATEEAVASLDVIEPTGKRNRLGLPHTKVKSAPQL